MTTSRLAAMVFRFASAELSLGSSFPGSPSGMVGRIKEERRLGVDVRAAGDRGKIRPAARSTQRYRASKRLPRIPSWTQVSPSASLPSAARHASFALVPVPHGERS
jgi:hypothetical protein